MRRFGMLAAAGLAIGLGGAAFGQGIDFASATSVNGPATVSGAVQTFQAAGVGPSGVDILSGAYSVAVGSIYNGRLAGIDHGLSAGAGFYLYTGAGYDSELRTLDENLVQIAQNDDGGPFGSSPNWGSALQGAVNADGSINFDITYFTDNSFAGASTAGGSTWHLQDLVSTPERPAITGQWWVFTGLTPGGAFSAETISGTIDTVVAAFASDGSSLGSDDDGAATGTLSLLTGTVPADGIVYVAVAGYHGGFNQPIQATQDYYTTGGDDNGTFELAFVPTPGSFALLGLGGLVAVRRRR